MGKSSKSKKKPIPIVHPLRSRKKAREITTKFHQLTHARATSSSTAELSSIEAQLEVLGGRKMYQEASQLNTSVFSTSKWVVGRLGNMGMLQGVLVKEVEEGRNKSNKPKRRPISVLEVGAINTQLQTSSRKPGVLMNVRSIDLRSTSDLIESADFNKLDATENRSRYDAIVCSMVINCVPTPKERGLMLLRLRDFTKVGGVVFLMLPLLCVKRSRYLDKKVFLGLLEGGLNFRVKEVKETPKVLMLVLVREEGEVGVGEEWKDVKIRNRGKKYKNEFAVCFGGEEGDKNAKKGKKG